MGGVADTPPGGSEDRQLDGKVKYHIPYCGRASERSIHAPGEGRASSGKWHRPEPPGTPGR